MRVCHPETIDEALALIGNDDATFVAGGTLLQLDWNQGVRPAAVLVALDRMAFLRGVVCAAEGIRIGAATTLAALEKEALVARHLPMLLAAIRVTSAPTIRTLGTIGGNVAGRRGCLIPALLALGARIEVARPGQARALALEEWLAEPADPACLVKALVVPPQPDGARWTYRKIGLRAAFTPSVIDAAGLVAFDGGLVGTARLAVGGGIVAPSRLAGAEAFLRGSDRGTVDWTTLHGLIEAEAVAPDDPFRSGRYRRRAAANALVHGLGGRLFAGPVPHARPGIRRAEAPDGEIRLGRRVAGDRWHVRPDERDKVEARLTYLTDMRRPDMLVGRILRAGIAHARIVGIDTARAEALPGVAAVVTHRDIKGGNGFGIVVQDQPALCHDKVRYVGDAVAAVAAVDAEVAARALALIDVAYEPLPVVDDMEAALCASAEPVHAGGNLQRELGLERGDVATAFGDAVHVVEAIYETPRQMHGFMETEGGYAFVDGEGTLTICAGGQHGRRDRLQLARILGLPEERIRVVTSPTGGAFGGKDELTVQPALALLALKSGRCVRLQLERSESVAAGTKSNPMRIRMKTACDADGRLLAQEVDLLADAGAYASLSPAVVETALEHACGPYVVANVCTRGRLAYTNNGTGGALRGFGCNQMTFAVECQMDRLAAACGLDPVSMRERNLRRPRSPGYLGQTVAPTERLAEMLDAAAADPVWRMPRGASADGSEYIGVGMGLGHQGNGLGTLPDDPGGGILSLAADGAIEAAFGLDEMGQGMLAAIRSAVAAALGCGADDVRPVIGDTGATPESGSTTACRSTYVVWRAAREMAPRLAEDIVAAGARITGRPASLLAVAPGGLVERGSNSGGLLLTFPDLARRLAPAQLPRSECSFEFPKSDYFKGNARLIFAFGATLARVAVDRVTGQIRVLDLNQHTAAGPMLDHATYLGQIEGGGVQGLGFTLTENAVLRDGAYVTGNLDSYMLPGIHDAPRSMASFALESLEADDSFGPRGIGELAIASVAPAIANAVADAIGVWPERAPVDPERILEALEGAG